MNSLLFFTTSEMRNQWVIHLHFSSNLENYENAAIEPNKKLEPNSREIMHFGLPVSDSFEANSVIILLPSPEKCHFWESEFFDLS